MGWLKKIQKLKLKDMDPFNKNSQLRKELANLDKNALQPVWDQILDPLLLDPISRAYIEYVEVQAKGKYKPLPQWLKLVLQELDVYDIDLNKVCYAEGINTLQEDNAITFGNNIHFPRSINLDRYSNSARDDVHWMLHELQHTVQYKRLGGVTAFVNKYIVQAGVGSLENLQKLGKSWISFVNKIHKDMPIEVEAEDKANATIDMVMNARDELSLNRRTPSGRNLGSRILLQDATMYEGDYLQSENSLYRFTLQGDGNVVLYAPQNEVIWQSYTDGMGNHPYRIVAQSDGNVVQYDKHNSPEHALWRTGTNGLGGEVLILQDDGNLVLYASGNKAVWESSSVKSHFGVFLLHTGTALHNTNDSFDFIMADWNGDGRPDLVAIKKNQTGTNSTEVHILSAASNFQNFILQTGTALHNTDDSFVFVMTDWNGDRRPDLVAIKKNQTGTNSTEVHILSGVSNFQDFILHTGTALHNTDNTFDFIMTDWNGDGRSDLVAIKKNQTGTNSTEVHILSAASGFQEFILHTGTALHNTDDTFDFIMTDWNGDGRPDLVAVKKSQTGTNSTEVHILSGVSNFQGFFLHTSTALHNTDETFDFIMTDWNGDGRPDLVAIKESQTDTNSTEVHILAG
ncbi:hypothetical protein N7475_000601 [Penicillium sp. IBT 31633x]|nr:hypothetical protein N7475_000601 [Penicillium sp. IBT 31633x]